MDDDRRMSLPTADAGPGETMNTTSMATTTTMEDDRPGSIPLTSSTMALSRQLLPTEVCTLCPVLIGTYTVDENGTALWTGRWAMLEAEYANGITSLFEMKSKKGHGATLDGHGDNVTDEDENRASPSPADDAPPKDTVVMERSFDGFFQIQTLKGKPNTVPEKDVVLSFYKCDVDHAYLVRGNGENRFGAFTLQGVLDDATKVMRLYKAYKPKDKTPVAKRTRPKPAPASATKAPALKKQKKALPGSTPMSEYNSSAPGTPDVEVTHVIVPHTKLSSVISISSGNSSPLISSRNRSERKRVIPAHLREDAGVDRDRAPIMRKCLGTLKTLMGNPKALPFLVPVDPVALGIPDYFNVIKDPMDLGTIRSNFEYGVYAEPEYFASHVRLVFTNAMLYNAPHTQVYVFAHKLLDDFEKKYKSLLKNESAAAKSRKHGNTSDGEGSVDSNRAKKSKRASLTKNQEIQSLKQEIEKMKVIVQEMASGKGTPPLGTPIGGNPIKSTKPRPFKMQDMTEEYLSRPMTATEKHKLTADLKELPEDKLSRVLQIISETVPLHTITQGDDEVELDINMFDTRCLRMIEGYVREQNIAKKRKRPAKRPSVKGASESRLQYAKEVAESVKSRHEQLKSQLAAIEGETYVPPQEVVAAAAPVPVPTIEHSSSGSSSDSSSSSDDDSDSSDSDTERPLQKVSSYHF
ncbi:hypothetical protein, variant [Saprolegnia diclina VS20]|uniref:Bromo domain-containing protein n=1 Tax=Saprolegnia diclina (strain VS20) TaxID=1156394 RepID=T0SAB4_SAPDV|nr:hypothetical protein, variant [Saprolegnia diclina VS20]EQC39742.1 hypothetical protein, variant [Saprolegnia diclina VS20]|eukprot:XP_008607014.1 hypothetical protein, variant [Saprolegnia diclina VS20]